MIVIKKILVLLLLALSASSLLANYEEDYLVKIEDQENKTNFSGVIIHESGVIVTLGNQIYTSETGLVHLSDKTTVKAELAASDVDNGLNFWVMEKSSLNWLNIENKSASPFTSETVYLKTVEESADYQKQAVCQSYFTNGNLRLSADEKELLDGSCAINDENEFVGLAFNRKISDKVVRVLVPSTKVMESYRKNITAILNVINANQTETVILKLQGSNTIGAQLADSLAKSYLLSIGSKNITFRQGASVEEKKVRGYLKGKMVSVEIKAHGSTTAFSGLKNSECDIGMASRPIKNKEVQELSALGNMNSYQNEHILALDGIAIVVNRTNPIGKLTIEQLSKIFSGEIKDWSEITPYFSGQIKLLSRDDKSGTFDSFKSMVLGSVKPEKKLAAHAEKIESSIELSDKIARDANSIGFIGLPYIRECKPVEIAQKIDENEETAFFPSVFSVATEDYALSRRLFLYTPDKNANQHCRAFVEYALSEKGQQIVEQCGFVSQNITLEQPTLASNATAKYIVAVKNSQRLSLNFRFKTGSFELDNKSNRDLYRVINFIKANRGKEIMLLGFADNVGDEQYNYQLSKRRAEVVRDHLKKWGVRTKNIVGFGPEVPIASNTSEEGRQKNRRVEILLKN